MRPMKIDIFEDDLYALLYDQSIWKMNKYGRDDGTRMMESIHRTSDILIMHPLKQPSNSNLFKLP